MAECFVAKPSKIGDIIQGAVIDFPTLEGASVMLDLNEQYITDKDGNRTAVVIPISKFEALQERLFIENTADSDEGPRGIKTGLTVAHEALRTLFKQTQQLSQIQTLTEDDIVAEVEAYRNNQ